MSLWSVTVCGLCDCIGLGLLKKLRFRKYTVVIVVAGTRQALTTIYQSGELTRKVSRRHQNLMFLQPLFRLYGYKSLFCSHIQIGYGDL